MKGSKSERSETGQTDLDRRILDELREGARTKRELVVELGEPRERIRSRLQFLDGAGYIETSEADPDRYELREDPRESGFFEDRPYLRPVAFGAVLFLSGSLYYAFLHYYLEPLIVAVAVAVPLAFVTARIVVAPRRREDSYTPIQRSHEADELPDTNEFER